MRTEYDWRPRFVWLARLDDGWVFFDWIETRKNYKHAYLTERRRLMPAFKQWLPFLKR